MVILNRPWKFNLSKVKLNYSPFYMREAPSATYGGISVDPISGISSDAPDSSNRVRGLDDPSFVLVGEAV